MESSSSDATSLNTTEPLNQMSFSVYLRELILRDKVEEPLLFKKLNKNWVPCGWSLNDWEKLFGDQPLSVRSGRKMWDFEYPQRESLCGRLEVTWKQFQDWSKEEFNLSIPQSSPKDIWMYFDYKHLPDIASSYIKTEAQDDILKLFSWENVGFPERCGNHSTLWIGTAGSYTNAHFDTYSSNLICQVYGKKTWLVFPPNDTEYLNPTRVPYEESSVYSGINFGSDKQIQKHMKALEKCNPKRITLEPGDCLYLPPKWWHFVKSEELSISVNTWIELPSDHFARVEEAVLRSVITSYINSSTPSTADRVLNPNEMDITYTSEKETDEMLRLVAQSFFKNMQGKTELFETSMAENKIELTSGSLKKRKLNLEEVSLSVFLRNFQTLVNTLPVYQMVKPKYGSQLNSPSTSEYCCDEKYPEEEQASATGSSIFMEDVLNAVGHPDILKQITLKFLYNINQRYSFKSD